MSAPSISVVVALISGRPDDLRRCLAALAAQTAPLAEILVPYDTACASVTMLQPDFPAVRFLRADGLETLADRAGGSREHHDVLRTLGLRMATSEIVLLTEDHAHAAPDWAGEMAAALVRHVDAGAAGGAVECDSTSNLAWAIWFCDFGRYQNPLPEGRAWFVSDSNVAYRARALARVVDAWTDAYREPAVHAALDAAGLALYTTPRAVVWQARAPMSMRDALRERYVWARSFAATRPGVVGRRRLLLAAVSPLLPVVLTWRAFVTARRRGRHVRRFLACAPLVMLLNVAWGVGELTGYATGSATGSRRRRV